MGKLVAIEFLSVDGVMQGLGSPEEDTEGGFRHGGWGAPYAHGIHQVVGSAGLSGTAAYLFGRKTYEKMAGFWPHQPDRDPIAAHLNAAPKYVASRTLAEASWRPSEILSGNVADEVGELKRGLPGDVAILGSGELCHALMTHDLVDELRLFIHPLLLGDGKRLFRALPEPRCLELQSMARTDVGTVALTYRVSKGEDS